MPHTNSITFIYSSTPGVQVHHSEEISKLIILDTKCVIFDKLYDSYHSGRTKTNWRAYNILYGKISEITLQLTTQALGERKPPSDNRSIAIVQ